MPSEAESSFEGTAFRHVSPGHEGLDPAALEGSKRAGGRFNPAGAFGAIYLSLDEHTAIAELRRRAARTGIAPEELLPRRILVVRAELQKVLDLTDPEVRSSWGLTADDLGSDDYRSCQEVAKAARRAGYEAIFFPSAADEEGRNLAVFGDRLRPGSDLEILETTPLRLENERNPWPPGRHPAASP